jgi:universal stress protein family protein
MTRNEIVVGLDDSPSAKAALRWAAEQAIRKRAALRAIHVLDWPYGPDDGLDAPRKNFYRPSTRRRPDTWPASRGCSTTFHPDPTGSFSSHSVSLPRCS